MWYYPYNGILYSHKKQWSIDSCYNMDKPQKCYAKWKKPEAKGNILYNAVYMKYPKQASP